MLYLLTGADDFSISQSLEEIKSKIGDQTMLDTNTNTLDGEQITIHQLRAVCESVPFLSEKRLVIVKGLLGRFESKKKPKRQQKIKKINIRQDGYKSLATYICQIPESTILVLVDSEVRNNNPLLKILSSKAEVKSFPLLRGPKLKQWIEARVAKGGNSISPKALEHLVNLVGSNLWIMSSEINKLLLFAAGRRIEEDDVERVVSYIQHISVFTMVDAIIEFKTQLAEVLLQQLLSEGASPSYLLAMLSRQVRLIVRIRELSAQRISETEIRNRLKISQDWVLRKTLEQASNYSFPRLIQVYQQLLETDVSIKTGKYDGELALNILIAELCQQDRVV